MNPLYKHLIRQSRWPSLRVTLYLGLILFVASSGYGIFLRFAPDVLNSNGVLSLGFLFSVVTGWVLALSVPGSVTGYAIKLVQRVQYGDDHMLLRITPMSAEMRIEGYVRAALHYTRTIYALMIGLSPLFLSAEAVVYDDPNLLAWIVYLLHSALILLGLFLWTGAGALAGILSGLKIRYLRVASFVVNAPLGVMMFISVVFAFVGGGIGLVFGILTLLTHLLTPILISYGCWQVLRRMA